MKIKELINGLKCELVNIDEDISITSICINSKECSDGSLFFCIKGNNTDGHNFANNAIVAGAKAIVCSKKLNSTIPQIRVKNVRKALAHICKALYKNPQEKLHIIGVVGTNGKTTVCETVYNILNSAKIHCGKIGTFGAEWDNKRRFTGFTTPDSHILYSLLNEMVQDGVKVVCMELSAHAIFYNKCDFRFDVIVYTNCTSEHLDFFSSFNQYANVKYKAFSQSNCKLAIVNTDDALGLQIAATKKNGVITYGIHNPADIFAIDIVENAYGVSFIINLFDVLYEVNSNRYGLFNVYNFLASATVSALCGVKTDFVAEQMQKLPIVKGRMERVAKKVRVFIDYAHTPDGLKNALTTLNSIKGNNHLICVFGCGGNRDKNKRAIMGSISGKLADFTVVTSDNPRFEEAEEIIKQIEIGVREETFKYITIVDRAEAIKYAIERARIGDYVLIAGKGAEEYQELMGTSRYFSDKETACSCVVNKYGEL